MSRASRTNRAEWLARTEQPPKPPATVRTNPRHARPPKTVTPADPEYERLHLRCPICGEVTWRPEFRPVHLVMHHGWRLPHGVSRNPNPREE